jgi:type IV pilus assembly protein PilV
MKHTLKFGYEMSCRKKEGGFTLVELLIAGVIIAVGILAWAKTQNSGIKNRAISSDVSIAVELATARMEILSFEIQKWAAGHSTTSGSDNSATIQGVTYAQSWSAETPSSGSAHFFPDGNPVWEVTVNVSWSRYGPKSVEYRKIVVGR